jgi:hypothetical protein
MEFFSNGTIYSSKWASLNIESNKRSFSTLTTLNIEKTNNIKPLDA